MQGSKLLMQYLLDVLSTAFLLVDFSQCKQSVPGILVRKALHGEKWFSCTSLMWTRIKSRLYFQNSMHF